MRFHANGAPRIGLCFETPGDSGGGAPKPTDPPTDPPADPPKPEATFTQAQVNALIKKKADELLKKELGVDDLDAIKTLLKKQKDDEEASKSEAARERDKAVKDALAAQQAKFDEERKTLLANQNRKTIEGEVRGLAREMNFHDPDDAWLRLSDVVGEAGEEGVTVSIGDDGKVTGVEDALKKLAKDKPYLIKQDSEPNPGVPNPGNGNRDGSLTEQQRIQRGANEIVFGRGRRR